MAPVPLWTRTAQSTAAEASQVHRTGRIRKRFAAVGIAIGLAAGFLGGWMLRSQPQPDPVRKLDLGIDIEPTPGTTQYVSISPDGSRVACRGEVQDLSPGGGDTGEPNQELH